ncbi:MAG: hypothetical protein ACC642_10885 [Pseudomonadales bacterium]
MGYTHRWAKTRPIDDSEWDAITTVTRKILTIAQENRGIALSEEYDINSIPVINDEEIRFNGYADEGHETFCLSREADEFTFCKTANKPYDQVVVAILQACAVYCSGFTWASDGDRRYDHAEGVKLYNNVTGANWDYSNVSEGIS